MKAEDIRMSLAFTAEFLTQADKRWDLEGTDQVVKHLEFMEQYVSTHKVEIERSIQLNQEE